MHIVNIPPDHPRAAEAGAYAYMTVMHVHHVQRLPMPQVLDSDVFGALWAQRALELFFVLDENEAFAACRVVAVGSHILSSSVMVARGVSLFVEPRYRRMSLARKLIHAGDIFLRDKRNVGQFEEVTHDPVVRELFGKHGYALTSELLVRGDQWDGEQLSEPPAG